MRSNYIKPGKLEIKLFKYICSQADYPNCKINELGGFHEEKYIHVIIRFKKEISELIRNFAKDNNYKFQEILDIANTWLRQYKRIIKSEEKATNYKYIQNHYYKSYYFDIFNSGFVDERYFNLIPRRVLVKICEANKFDFNKITMYTPLPNSESKLKKEDKKFFRYICRHADLNNSIYKVSKEKDGSENIVIKLQIPCFNTLLKQYTSDERCTCSKNVMKNILNKLVNPKAFIVTDAEKEISYITLFSVDPIRNSYIRNIPKPILASLRLISELKCI